MRSPLIVLFAALWVVASCGRSAEPASDTLASVPPASTTSPAVVATDASESTIAPADTSPPTEPTVPLAPLLGLTYEEVASGLPFPIALERIPGSEDMALASKDGRLWHLRDGVIEPTPLLDIRENVRDQGERGLLGLAFSPDFADSGRVFVHYSANDGDTVLSEFTADTLSIDPATEVEVFRVDQPAGNHNGGMLQFGPEGFLYLGLGDGGRSNDAFGNGQNDATPLGALLRFDTSQPGVATPAADGSFSAGAVWSIGLRNPWRFYIDDRSGLIFIGDVGQNAFEEISVASIAQTGVNYGWPITEGAHCFNPSTNCDITGLTLPTVEIAHGDAGTCSITGGVVYRGAAIPELDGVFLFSDFCGGYLRGFPVEGAFDEPTDWTEDVGRAGSVSSFGVDAQGEVYVLTAEGSVLRLVADRG